MRTIRKPKSLPAPTAAPVGPVPPVVPLDEAAQAEQLRSEAAEIRTGAERARTEAEALLQAARAEAQRLVAEAEQQAAALTAGTRGAERRAAGLDETAGYLAHAHTLRGQAEDADQTVAALEAEAAGLAEQDAALVRRQAELGQQREDATTALTTAREAGDVAAVGELRSRLAAVDEVAGVLEGRRQRITGRLHAIGEAPGVGELAQAMGRAETLRAELRQTLNTLDPERPEARADHLIAIVQANFARVLEPDPQPASRPHEVVRTATDPSTGYHVLQS